MLYRKKGRALVGVGKASFSGHTVFRLHYRWKGWASVGVGDYTANFVLDKLDIGMFGICVGILGLTPYCDECFF